MELTKKQVNITKGVAILFMIFIHLFCRKEITGYYNVFFNINGVPLVYYLSLLGDSCVPIYCFCSGYGLLIGYKNDRKIYFKKNMIRLLKLYINYWVVLVIFVLGIGFIMGQSQVYPGDIKTFILNFTAISTSYNGAWWFLTIYIILVLLSPFINWIIINHNCKLIILVSLIFYFIAYIQRIKVVLVFDNTVLNWSIRQISLLGTSQLCFVIGGVFAEKKIYSKVYNTFKIIKYKNLILNISILTMIVFHSFVETMFIAPFIGIAFICLFNLLDKPIWLNSLLSYLSRHSTNMWLTHMFFYMIFFEKLVFYSQYPLLIFPWLIILCLVTSYIINFIYNPIAKLLNRIKWISSNTTMMSEVVQTRDV